MKHSIPVRILAALGGLVLLAASAGVVAEGFFGVPVLTTISGVLASQEAWAVLVKIVGALALAVLAVMAVTCALPGKAPKQSGSIMQKGENGPIGITVEAIRKMALACAQKHPEITHADVDVREVRDGIVILMDVTQVGGVSIPLSVARLQKQIRQYVNDRTGLDVTEVRVMVDNKSDDHVASEFEVEDRVMPSVPVKTEDYAQSGSVPEEPLAEQLRQIAEITTQTVQAEPTPAEEEPSRPEAPVVPPQTQDLDELLADEPQKVPELIDEAEKPLHQRVFGAEEMPLTVPMPPEMEAEQASEQPEAAPAQPETEASDESRTEAAEAPAAPQAQEDWTDPSMQAAAEEVLASSAETPAEESGAPAGEADEAPAEESVEASEEDETPAQLM